MLERQFWRAKDDQRSRRDRAVPPPSSDRLHDRRIATLVTAIQSATDGCVIAIGGIGDTIREIRTVGATIAAAIEEQDSATREIARSVQQAAAGTSEVSKNVGGASHAAEQSRALADSVMATSTELGQHATALLRSVDNFLAHLHEAA